MINLKLSVIIDTQPIFAKSTYYKYYALFYPQICKKFAKNAEKVYYIYYIVLHVIQFATSDVLQIIHVLPVIHFQTKKKTAVTAVRFSKLNYSVRGVSWSLSVKSRCSIFCSNFSSVTP